MAGLPAVRVVTSELVATRRRRIADPRTGICRFRRHPHLQASLRCHPRPRKAGLQVNNVYGIYRAVLSGLGLGALPDYFEVGTTSLVRVLPEMQSPPTEVYFVYPEELRHSARIEVFRDFLVRKVIESRS